MQEAASQRDLPRAHQDLVPVPSGFSPEGIQEELLSELFDENTFYLLRKLPRQYFHIFVHILRYATLSPRTSMQQGLFTDIGEGNDEAIVLFRSVEALASAEGSPAAVETYAKAIILLEALHIISQRSLHCGTNERYTEIRIPLGKRDILIDPLLESLMDRYLEYTSIKVRQMLVKTAELIQTGEFVSHVPRPTAMVDPSLRSLLTQFLLEQGIQEEHIRVPSLVKTCSLLSQAFQNQLKNGRVGVQAGELLPARTMRHRRKAGELGKEMGELGKEEVLPTQDGREEAKDLPGELGKTESPVSQQKKGRRRAHCLKEGELAALFRPESPFFKHFGSFVAQTGEFGPSVSITDSSSSLDSSLKGRNTLIDAGAEKKGKELPAWVTYVDLRPHREIEHEMQTYKNMFDPNMKRKWTGSLYNAVRWTPPETRRLAAIGAIFYQAFRQPDGTFVKRPGGWFTKACQRFQEPEVLIPAELSAWDQTGLSLTEIESKIKQGIHHPAPTTLFVEGSENAQTSVLGGDLSSSQEYAFPGEAPRTMVSGSWMDLDGAEELCRAIQQEGSRFSIKARVLPGNETGVFVVETNWEGVIELHADPTAWASYFAEVSSLFNEPGSVEDHKRSGREPERNKPEIVEDRAPGAIHPAIVIVEDRLRTAQEWAAAPECFGSWAEYLDPVISGKWGQDDRWAHAVYLNICDLGESFAPRFLEMAQETWGIAVDWENRCYHISTEQEMHTFLNTVGRKIQKQARLQVQSQSESAFLQWQIAEARKESAEKVRR